MSMYLITLRKTMRYVKIFFKMALPLLTILLVFTKLSARTEKENEMPVIVWWTGEGTGSTGDIHCKEKNVKCRVVTDRNAINENTTVAALFYGSLMHFDDLPLPRRPNDFIWGLFHEESPRNVPILMHASVLRLFNFSATFSRYSDVPFPLQYLNKLDDIITRKYYKKTSIKNSLLKTISPILYLQSDCTTSTQRDEYVKELMKLIPIDSYGACLKNKKMPEQFTKDYLNHLEDDDFLKFISQYKFVIAIENGSCDDYITEKLWRAIKTGSVPIYFGSPSVRDWLPNEKSAILIEDYPTTKVMKEHIEMLLHDDAKYEEYLEHKTKQLITNQMLIDSLTENPDQGIFLHMIQKFECIICENLYLNRDQPKVINVVNEKHYNCPRPISALTLTAKPDNKWVRLYDNDKKKARFIRRASYRRIT